MSNKEMLRNELNLIQDKDTRELIEKCLENAPEYFYHVSASSSGKYHPSQDLGEGGLIRHTKAVVQVAMDLIRSEVFSHSDTYKDEIISACILHDLIKNGFEDSGHTVSEHPLLVSNLIFKLDNINSKVETGIIGQLIQSHMGKWNTDKEGNEILSRPETDIEKLVHLADYIASRKYIDMSQIGLFD